MSLHAKFGVLIALFGASVLLCLGAAWWAFSTVDSEVTKPIDALYFTMSQLGRTQSLAHQQRQSLDAARRAAATAPQTARDQYAGFAAQINSAVSALETDKRMPREAGVRIVPRIRGLVRAADAGAAAWFDNADAPAADRAIVCLDDLDLLLQRVQDRKLQDTTYTAIHGKEVAASARRVLLYSAALCVLSALLGFALLKRWVTRPVEELRVAAKRIGGGDFAHRVDIRSSDEIGQLGSEVNHMTALVRTMQEERIEHERLAAVGEMVRRIAHNLRNPLAGIRGLAELSRADLAADPSGSPGTVRDIKENQGRIITAVDRFEKWLADLLGATTPSRIQVRTCEVAPWLEGITEAHQPMARAKGVTLIANAEFAPKAADFDPSHLEHAVIALLSNAIQATPAGSKVWLTVTETSDGAAWRIEVVDQGPGVPPDIRSSVFKPYFTTKKDGTGIGLAVANQTAVAHNGKIELLERPISTVLDTNERVGAVFALEIPYRIELSERRNTASIGQSESDVGQNTHHRGRGQPEILDPADAGAGRS